MSQRALFIMLAAAFIIFSAAVFIVYKSTPKVAYVRNMDIVYGYNGMKQAHEQYASQTTAWQANIDTVKMRYQKSLAYYQQNLKSFSAKEKEEQVALLTQMEKDMQNYAGAIQKEAKEKETRMTQGVLSQINSFVEEYGKSKGYDIILGADGNGGVIYGNKSMDITQEVLEALNKQYKMLPADSIVKLPAPNN
ncbi:MAG: OmpH family outer membrane protein [Bacteroidetes bacterium]|nr:OmpH family outer membrane protein [Bacteroidota bacterium]